MADMLQAANGTTTLLPTTTWAAPNGLFGAADRNDSSIYGWSDSLSRVTLPSSGLADGYLFLWGFEFEDNSNGRHNPQGRMIQASGTGTFASASTGGYNRDNSEDRSYVSGWSFVDNPSASATFDFQWRRDNDAPTGGTVRSFIQVVPLYYSDVAVYTSSSTTATGGTTPVQITGFTGTDGTNITLSSNTVTLAGANKRYLCLGAGYHQGIGGSRTQRWFGFRVDGTKDDAAKGCMYYRNSSNADGGESFMRLLERNASNRTIDLFQYRGDGVAADQGGADVDGNTTGSNSSHAIVCIEFNDDAEVWSSVDSVGGQEFALTGPVDVDIASTGDIEFNDSASFTRASDIAVNCEVAMDVLAFANVSRARGASSIGSGARFTVHGEFTLDGTEQTDIGFHGNYNRGNQGSQDTHGDSCNMAGVFAVTANQDIGVSNQELAGTEGGGGDIETQAGWVGFGLVNLDTLQASGGGDDDTAEIPAASLELTGNALQAVTTENNVANAPAGSLEFNGFALSSVTTENIVASVPVASIELNEFAPSAITSEGDVASIPVTSIDLTGLALQSVTTEDRVAAIPVASLEHTALSPQSVTTEAATVLLPSVALQLSPNAFSVITTELNTAQIPAASMELTAIAFNAVTGDGNTAEIPTLSLELSPNTFTAETTEGEDNTAAVPLISILLTAYPPTVSGVFVDDQLEGPDGIGLTGPEGTPLHGPEHFQDNDISQLPAASIQLTANTFDVVASEPNDAQIPVASLEFAGIAPQVVVSDFQLANIPVAAIDWTGIAFTAETTQNIVVQLPVANLELQGIAPAVEVTTNDLVYMQTASLGLTLNVFTVNNTSAWQDETDSDGIWIDETDAGTGWIFEIEEAAAPGIWMTDEIPPTVDAPANLSGPDGFSLLGPDGEILTGPDQEVVETSPWTVEDDAQSVTWNQGA